MVLTFLIALLTTPAQAKDHPTIAVVGVHDPGLDLAQQRDLVRKLVETLDAGKRFDGLGPEDVARALAGREEVVLGEAFLGPGRRLLEDGRILHDQAQPEEAVPTLEQAISSLEGSMPNADASRDLWEAYLYLGSAHLALGKDDAARTAWGAAVALNPERQPDAARIAPNVVQGYRDVQTAARKGGGTLTVKAAGAAQVSLNGRDIGTSPAKVEGVAPGLVHLRVHNDQGLVGYKTVEVGKGSDTKVEVTLFEPQLQPEGTTAFARARQATDLYRALGQAARPDLILVAGGGGGSATLQLYSPSADTFSRPLDLTCDAVCDTEFIDVLGEVLSVVTDTGGLPAVATTPKAAPLDMSTNRLLASLLLDPQPITAGPSKSTNLGTVIAAGGAGALLVGGGVTAAVLLSGSGEKGTIVIGPVP